MHSINWKSIALYSKNVVFMINDDNQISTLKIIGSPPNPLWIHGKRKWQETLSERHKCTHKPLVLPSLLTYIYEPDSFFSDCNMLSVEFFANLFCPKISNMLFCGIKRSTNSSLHIRKKVTFCQPKSYSSCRFYLYYRCWRKWMI